MDLNSIVYVICKLISLIKSINRLKNKKNNTQVIMITNNINIYPHTSSEK